MALCCGTPRPRRVQRLKRRLDSQLADLQGQARPSHHCMVTRIGLLFSSQVSSSRDHLLPSSGSNCSALAAQRRAWFGSLVEVQVEKDGGEGEKDVQDDLTIQLASSYVRSVHDTLPHSSALRGQSPTLSLRRGLFMCADLLTSRDRIARML